MVKTFKMSRKVAKRLQWSVISFIVLFFTIGVSVASKFYDIMIIMFIGVVIFNLYLIFASLIEKFIFNKREKVE
jgi:hypothetical protein